MHRSLTARTLGVERDRADDVALARFAEDVRAGLGRAGQKQLDPKYLYDDVGSALFEAICCLPEYGLARAGARCLRAHADEIAERVGGPLRVVELGSGNGKTTRVVLEAIARRRAVAYYAIDVSRAALAACRGSLDGVPGLTVYELEREFLPGLIEATAWRRPDERVLVLFLGSTIGNFERAAAETLMLRARATLRRGDALLLATDLVKPAAQLVKAYDDCIGVTAAFDKNVLARMNRELGADFDLESFRHEARWNETERRIEMHLRALTPQVVTVPKASLRATFEAGESLWTECSHKFAREEVVALGARTGFRCAEQWIDREWPFAQSLLVAE